MAGASGAIFADECATDEVVFLDLKFVCPAPCKAADTHQSRIKRHTGSATPLKRESAVAGIHHQCGEAENAGVRKQMDQVMECDAALRIFCRDAAMVIANLMNVRDTRVGRPMPTVCMRQKAGRGWVAGADTIEPRRSDGLLWTAGSMLSAG